MIQEVDKDIWGAGRVYFNPVNTVGVMGAGVAALMKNSFPYHFEYLYMSACKSKRLVAGKSIQVVYVAGPPDMRGRVIVNIPTKFNWKGPAQLDYIEAGLRAYRNANINETWEISMPRLGCGLGGLKWEEQVLPLVKRHTQPFFNVNIPTRPTNALNPNDWIVLHDDIVYAT
jgi:O-acetyl-ADP-ribose deacetylase (regulator of RNase III)